MVSLKLGVISILPLSLQKFAVCQLISSMLEIIKGPLFPRERPMDGNDN